MKEDIIEQKETEEVPQEEAKTEVSEQESQKEADKEEAKQEEVPAELQETELTEQKAAEETNEDASKEVLEEKTSDTSEQKPAEQKQEEHKPEEQKEKKPRKKKKSRRKKQYDRLLTMVRIICVLGIIAFCCIPDKEKPAAADQIASESGEEAVKELRLPVIKRAEKEINERCESYRTQVEQMAARYGIPQYADLLMALMMQESAGKGLDIMQSSEGAFNTRYPRVPNGITDISYSIECGVQELKEALVKAGAQGPDDIPRIEQALQAYNFGIRYLDFSEEKGVTEWNEEIAAEYAKIASNGRTRDEHDTKTMGKWDYGDQFYPEHVLRYYPISVTQE